MGWPSSQKRCVLVAPSNCHSTQAHLLRGMVVCDCWHHSKTTIPLNRWACVEWQFDGATNTQRFWLDGQPIDDLTVVGKGDGCINHDLMDNWYFPTFNALRLGWEHYQLGPGEAWIDDVAVDSKRVGCPAN